MSLDTQEIDFSEPRTPCQTEGCNWPNFHVCLVGKEDRSHEFPELQQAYIPGQKKRRPSEAGKNGRALYMSDEHRAKTSASAQARWASHHARNAERNKNIVKDYSDGLNLRQLRVKYGIGHGTLVKILHDARDRGDVVMRTKGYMEYGQRKQTAV